MNSLPTQDRASFIELPSRAELQQLLAMASRREVPADRRGVHFLDLRPAINLCEGLGLPAEVFTSEVSFSTILRDGFLEQASDLIAYAVRTLTSRTPEPKCLALLDSAYEYLSQEDPCQRTDAIFVFGARTPSRAEKAAELYKLGQAGLVIVSGDRPIYEAGRVPSEASEYRRILLSIGVPREAILIESRSLTMPDNVRSTLNLLDEREIRLKSITLVNSPYSQRRGWAHFRKYLPVDVPLVRVNAETKPDFSRQCWYRRAPGIKVVLGEYVRMKIAIALNSA